MTVFFLKLCHLQDTCIMFQTLYPSRKVFSGQVRTISQVRTMDGFSWSIVYGRKGIILCMLPDLQMNDHLRLRKPHPCGSYEWTVVRLGADIGLECKGCQHRVMLTRRELTKRMKTNLSQQEREKYRDSEEHST